MIVHEIKSVVETLHCNVSTVFSLTEGRFFLLRTLNNEVISCTFLRNVQKIKPVAQAKVRQPLPASAEDWQGKGIGGNISHKNCSENAPLGDIS
jgi:hypothetical protein